MTLSTQWEASSGAKGNGGCYYDRMMTGNYEKFKKARMAAYGTMKDTDDFWKDQEKMEKFLSSYFDKQVSLVRVGTEVSGSAGYTLLYFEYNM